MKVTGSSYFEGDVEITGSLTATIASDTINLATSNTNSNFKIPFANHTGNTAGDYALLQDSESGQFTYNPDTNTLTVGTVDGTVSTATNATDATNADHVKVKTIGSSVDNHDHQITFNLGTNTNFTNEDIYNAEDLHYNPYTDRLGIKVGRRNTVSYDHTSNSNVFRTSGRLHINQIELSSSITKNDVDITSGTDVIDLSSNGGSTGIAVGMYVRPAFNYSSIVIQDDTKVIGVDIAEDGNNTVRLSRNVTSTLNNVDLVFGYPDYDEAFLVTDSGNVAISTSPFGTDGDGEEPYKLGVGGNVWIEGSIATENYPVDLAGGTAGDMFYQQDVGITTSLAAPSSAGYILGYDTTNNKPTWVESSGTGGIDANCANQVKTTTTNSSDVHHVTIVNSDNSSATCETVYTESNLVYVPSEGNFGIGNNDPKTTLQVNDIYGVETQEATTYTATAGAAQTIDTFDLDDAAFKTAEYTIYVTNGSNVQAGKALLMITDSTVHISEYGIMYEPNRIVNFTASIDTNTKVVSLIATAETGISGNTTYRFTRETML